MKAITHTRPVRASRKRVSKTSSAAEALSGFGHAMEVDCLTMGQFSIIDAIAAVLNITGPANVTLCTWTAAEFDVDQLSAMIHHGKITDFRLIIDRGFVSCVANRFRKTLAEYFGINAIRETLTHAKFTLISNSEWSVVIRTSMNLNNNPRIEYIQVADDPELMAFYKTACDAIFNEEDVGLRKKRKTPKLSSMPQERSGSLPFEFRPLPTWRT